MTKRALAVILILAASPTACKHITDANPVLLTANIVDPQDVDAVSDFNSCSGHPFPESNSPNSAKNYFWPNSTNFSTNGVLKEFAACDGIVSQNGDDTDDPMESIRGVSLHLTCDNSSTALRYFHVIVGAGTIGSHVPSGAMLGYAAMLNPGQSPSNSWQNSSNFDIAVVEATDDRTEDYFAKLDAPTFAAWTARGLTSVSQTVNLGNPTCTSFAAVPGDAGIFVFAPVR